MLDKRRSQKSSQPKLSDLLDSPPPYAPRSWTDRWKSAATMVSVKKWESFHSQFLWVNLISLPEEDPQCWSPVLRELEEYQPTSFRGELEDLRFGRLVEEASRNHCRRVQLCLKWALAVDMLDSNDTEQLIPCRIRYRLDNSCSSQEPPKASQIVLAPISSFLLNTRTGYLYNKHQLINKREEKKRACFFNLIENQNFTGKLQASLVGLEH